MFIPFRPLLVATATMIPASDLPFPFKFQKEIVRNVSDLEELRRLGTGPRFEYVQDHPELGPVAIFTFGSLLVLGGGGVTGCVEVAIDREAGTPIGDLTGTADLDEAFDGETNRGVAACARTVGDVSDAFIGKDWESGNTHQITEVKYYGPNDNGVIETASVVTLAVYEHTADAGPATAGTVIGTTGTFDGSAHAVVKTITCSGGTQKQYHWLHFNENGSGGGKAACAELQFKGC